MREAQYRSGKWLRRATALSFGAFAVVHSGCGLPWEPKRPLTFEQFEAQAHREAVSGLYIVDGDTPVRNREELREVYRRYVDENGGQKIGTRRHALAVHQVEGADSRWDHAQALNLFYCVSTTFGANYLAAVQAMEEATASGWEIPANVHFIHQVSEDVACDETNENVVFDVRPIEKAPYLARAFFPTFERAYRNIMVDTRTFGDIGSWTIAGVLRHETGHALGFRHEHTRPETGVCFEDDNWRPLTTYDSDSVMHYPQCNGTNQGDLLITTLDAEGAAALYPLSE